MKKIIFVFLVITLLVGFAASGPFIALSKLEQAVETEDHMLLHEAVDFLALKKNLKQQFGSHVNAVDSSSSSLDNLLSEITNIFIEEAVDTLVTPEGFISMMQSNSLVYDPKEGRIGNKPEKKPVREVFKDATYSIDGINQFSVWVKNKEGNQSRFIFSRYGVTWRLVNIVLPLDANE